MDYTCLPLELVKHVLSFVPLSDNKNILDNVSTRIRTLCGYRSKDQVLLLFSTSYKVSTPRDLSILFRVFSSCSSIVCYVNVKYSGGTCNKDNLPSKGTWKLNYKYMFPSNVLTCANENVTVKIRHASLGKIKGHLLSCKCNIIIGKLDTAQTGREEVLHFVNTIYPFARIKRVHLLLLCEFVPAIIETVKPSELNIYLNKKNVNEFCDFVKNMKSTHLKQVTIRSLNKGLKMPLDTIMILLTNCPNIHSLSCFKLDLVYQVTQDYKSIDDKDTIKNNMALFTSVPAISTLFEQLNTITLDQVSLQKQK
jgi:hypothetical protein